MLYSYWLAISGITIQLETDHPIVENEEFQPFRLKRTTAEIRAVYYGTDTFLPISENIIAAEHSFKIVENKDGNLKKYFYERHDDPQYYASATYDWANGRVYVDYLNSYNRCVSEMQNCFYLLNFESILLQRNKLCFHASCIETSIGGILFSGVSGIGKSTQADLWCKYRGARQINGDRPILSKENAQWTAWGSPYAGSSKVHVNANCPIKAIILLKQAPECSIHKLSSGEAFRGIWSGLTVHTWEKSFVEKASALAIDLISSVPVFAFSCTPDEQAVDYLEQALQKEFCL
ncbi:MAG: hypothetical protein IJ325_10530 [Clostridia bacterium]|nr:hypothetical protein [Clostridia bacterium]